MLGMSSRDWGVQSYSESSKKSLSFLVIIVVMRWSARERVAPKELEAVNWIVPHRCVDLRYQNQLMEGQVYKMPLP